MPALLLAVALLPGCARRAGCEALLTNSSATAVEQLVALPGRAVDAVASLPTVPVRLAGELVQSYLQAGQTLTDLAVKGDRVIASVLPARSDQPAWATFDEDLEPGPQDPGDGPPDVPSGRVTPRDT